jgi:hypothetical protein
MNSQNYRLSQLSRFINLALFFFLLFLSSSFALTVDITDISDNKYFAVVNQELKAAKKSIEEIYGRESVSLARKLAGMLDEENNFGVVEKFIGLINTYDYNWVEQANKITAKLAGENPARNVYYTQGILKRWSEQGHMD